MQRFIRPCTAVLFDLDGTLLDTAQDMAGALNDLRAEHRCAALPFAALRSQVSHGAAALVRAGFPAAQGTEFEGLRQRFLELYAGRLATDTRLFPGGEWLLAQLETAGLPWGVVTNKPGFLTAPLLTALGLAERAACVVSGDTLPERKPHPAPLLHAAALAGVDPAQCLYVGDAERDIAAGRAAGMFTLVARFGYLAVEDQPATWGADGEIATLAEVAPWIGLQPSSP